MIELGFENDLRLALGVVPLTDALDGASPCQFPSTEARKRTAWLMRQDPDGLWLEISERLRAGRRASALVVIDDFMHHPEYAEAAVDFALFLAADPSSLPGHQTENQRTHHTEALRSVFLRLKAAQVAIRGGIYPRARACLLEADHLAEAIAGGNGRIAHQKVALGLLQANVALLWGRFYQVMDLPHRSLEDLAVADRRFHALADGSAPPLFDMLLVRSMMDMPERFAEAQALFEQIVPPGHRAWPRRGHKRSLYGAQSIGYYHYLNARLSLRSNGDAAEDLLKLARREVRRSTHGDAPDPIRMGFLHYLEGRLLAEKHPDRAERCFLTARDTFRAVRFAPGEYHAVKHYVDLRIAESPPESETLAQRLRKNVRQLAERARVEVFEVRARYDLAKSYLELGRLDAASREYEQARRLCAEEGLAGVTGLPTAEEWSKLEHDVRDADENAVQPAARWGASSTAAEEREIVEDLSARGAATVIVGGKAECGQTVLIDRIREARGSASWVAQIDCATQDGDAIVRRLERVAERSGPIKVLHLDRASQPVQKLIAERLRDRAAVYITLSVPTADAALRPPCLKAWPAAVTLDVTPFDGPRRADILPIARGLLTRELARRSVDGLNASLVTFTGDASARLRDGFHKRSLAELATAMAELGRTIDEDDWLQTATGVFRITREALLRHGILPGGASAMTLPAEHAARARGRALIAKLGKEGIKKASRDHVAELAQCYHGNFSCFVRDVADLLGSAGLRRPTIIKIWKQRQVLETWRAF